MSSAVELDAGKDLVVDHARVVAVLGLAVTRPEWDVIESAIPLDSGPIVSDDIQEFDVARDGSDRSREVRFPRFYPQASARRITSGK